MYYQAYSQGMIYPEYIWMSYGWYTKGWWMYTWDTNCSVDQLQAAINRSLSFHHFPLPMQSEVDAPTDVNYVSKK